MLRRLASEESGIALVMALITMAVVGSLSASVMFAVSSNERNANNDTMSNQAFALAQDGLAYAEGRLYVSNDQSNGADVPTTTFSKDAGTVTYSGALASSTWTLKGVGSVGGISRTVTAQAVVPPPVTTTDTSIWNYFYVNSSSGCTNISGSVTINVPLYTNGSLCMSGNASFTGSSLEIAGNLTMTGSTQIGVSTNSRISTMNIGGTCAAPCDGNHSPIWVNVPGVGHTLPSETMPTINLANEYATTNPGPAAGHACQSGSGVPATFFDNDTTLNNSVNSVNLFPAGTAYDCKIGTNEIKWDGVSKLYVNGTFYFDGTLSTSGSTAITYTGSGTLYFTGKIQMSGSSSLCGIANCTSSWNPNTNVLVMVAGCWANSTGSQLATNNCCSLSGSMKLQVGLYCATDYTASGSSTNMGPVLTNTATLSGSVGQMIPINNLPPGAPANTTTVVQPAAAPTNFSG